MSLIRLRILEADNFLDNVCARLSASWAGKSGGLLERGEATESALSEPASEVPDVIGVGCTISNAIFGVLDEGERTSSDVECFSDAPREGLEVDSSFGAIDRRL